MATIHVVGAGISGLAAASALSADHLPVKLYEATASAGGRARSATHPSMGVLDHGLHLIPGHFRETFHFLDRISACDRLIEVPQPYAFASQRTGERWTIGRGRPLPAASLSDIAELAKMTLLPDEATAGHFFDEENTLRAEWAENFARLWLHTPLDDLSARAMRKALWKGIGKRSGALHMVQHSLRHSFLEPALAFLEYTGASVYFGHALNGFGREGDCIASLNFARKKVPVAADDVIILAGSPALAASLLPDITSPDSTHSAITLHFAAEHREKPGSLCFLTEGLLDLLRYDEGVIHASIRVAEGAWASDQQHLAERCWRQIRQLHPYLRSAPLGEWVGAREKRAGHRLDLETTHLPPTPRQPQARCILAGDWLEPAAPATLESAARSGHEAAKLARDLLGQRPRKTQSFS